MSKKKKHDLKSFRIRPKLDTVAATIARLVDEARFESWHLGFEAAVASYEASPNNSQTHTTHTHRSTK